MMGWQFTAGNPYTCVISSPSGTGSSCQKYRTPETALTLVTLPAGNRLPQRYSQTTAEQERAARFCHLTSQRISA